MLQSMLLFNSFYQCLNCISSSRMIEIQTIMSERAYELLNLPEEV